MVYVELVAPAMSMPSFFHWYSRVSPSAITSSVRSVAVQIVPPTGCVVIAVWGNTTSVAVALVTVLQLPITSTV